MTERRPPEGSQGADDRSASDGASDDLTDGVSGREQAPSEAPNEGASREESSSDEESRDEVAAREEDVATSETVARARERKPDARHYGDWKARFLEVLAIIPNVRAAAAEAGVSRSHAFRVRSQDKDFAARWHEAIQEGVDRLEQEAWRRSVEGYERPVYGNRGETIDKKGNRVKLGTGVVGSVREYDSHLMIQLLKAHRPEKYAPEVQINVGLDVGVDQEIAELARELKELARSGIGGRALPQVVEAEVVEPSSNGHRNGQPEGSDDPGAAE